MTSPKHGTARQAAQRLRKQAEAESYAQRLEELTTLEGLSEAQLRAAAAGRMCFWY